MLAASAVVEAVPQENVKKSNKKIFIIPIILAIVAVAIVLVFLVTKFGGNKDYPNLVGKIHLDMTQDEVEKILKKEITEEIEYYDSYPDGKSISFLVYIDEKVFEQMAFMRKHPDVAMIYFYFDEREKLQSVEITVLNSMQSTVEEFGLGVKYEEMRREGRDGKKRYAVIGKTRIEIRERDGFPSRGETAAEISYVRTEDADE